METATWETVSPEWVERKDGPTLLRAVRLSTGKWYCAHMWAGTAVRSCEMDTLDDAKTWLELSTMAEAS